MDIVWNATVAEVLGDAGGVSGIRVADVHSGTSRDIPMTGVFIAIGHEPNPKWYLAPIEMAWVGKSLAEICEQIKDKERNGGMIMEQLVHHMGKDKLVGWAWTPGTGRTPAPGTQQAFGEII